MDCPRCILTDTDIRVFVAACVVHVHCIGTQHTAGDEGGVLTQANHADDGRNVNGKRCRMCWAPSMRTPLLKGNVWPLSQLLRHRAHYRRLGAIEMGLRDPLSYYIPQRFASSLRLVEIRRHTLIEQGTLPDTNTPIYWRVERDGYTLALVVTLSIGGGGGLPVMW
jgi:hypothetical protein